MKYLLPTTLLLILLSGCAGLEKAQAKLAEVTNKATTATGKFADKGKAHLDEKTSKVAEASSNYSKIEEATPEQEAKIGRESASVLLGAAPLLSNKELTHYINSLGGWIALQTGRKDINWRYGVIDSPNINAFAAPDGYIFITRGLLKKLNNEAELAGVIAHEMAHVIKRHYITELHKKEKMGGIGSVLSASVEVVGIPGKAVNPVFNLAQNVYSSGLDKDAEYEADQLGILYATRAGYEPYGLPRVLSMYAANSGNDEFDLLFATHPSPQARLEELGNLIEKKYSAFESSGLIDAPQFKRIQRLI